MSQQPQPASMEGALNVQMDRILAEAGPHAGVVLADAHGFCIASRGTLNSMTAGHVAALKTDAAALAPAASAAAPPVIAIVTDHSRVLITQQGDLTLAVSRAVEAK